MTTQHTPGPWFPVDTGNEPPFITDKHGLEIPNTWENCQMKAAAPTMFERIKTLEAQRDELLEALEWILSARQGTLGERSKATTAAKAAIAKAKGADHA